MQSARKPWCQRRPVQASEHGTQQRVTEDGGEIGRSQALQAQACRLPPHTDFNPILLKPSSDTGAQVIIHGHAIEPMEAGAYHAYKKVAMDAVLESHQRLVINTITLSSKVPAALLKSTCAKTT